MKKMILFMAVAVLGTVSASAQWYAGGSLNISSKSTSYKGGGDGPSEFNFTIAPEVGYELSHKLELGASIDFASDSKESVGSDAEGKPTVNKIETSSWGINPYARYSVFEHNKLSVWGQATLKIGGGDDGSSYTHFGLGVVPVLKYSVSDKIDLITRLNFLSLGFDIVSNDIGSNTYFNLGATTSTIVGTLGGINIGFEYKF